MPVKYDSSILVAFADDLYEKASLAVLRGTLVGAVIGLAAVGALYKSAPGQPPSVWTWGMAALSTLAGYLVGQSRAFKYRLEAQRTLCQVAIERNTSRAPQA